MRKSFLLTFVIAPLLLITTPCYGFKTEEFIDYLANKIYEDCQRQCEDIKIKEGFISKSATNQLLRFPYYNVEAIKNILITLSKAEPFDRYTSTQGGRISMGSGRMADKILTSGTHALDINYDDWYWDGRKVELPAQHIDIKQEVSGGSKASIYGNVMDDVTNVSGNASYSKTIGNDSPAVSGRDNTFKQSNLFIKILTDIRFTIPLSIAVTFSFALNIFLLFKPKKKK